MDSKWRCVMLVMTASVFVNYALSLEVPACCPKPENAIPITLNQILGVWHHQASAVDLGSKSPNNDSACNIIDNLKTGEETAFQAKFQYEKSTNDLQRAYGPVRVLNNEVIVTDSIWIPSIKIYSYPLLLTGNVLVYTNCVVNNNEVTFKGVTVQTRKISVDQKYVDQLLTIVNMTNMKVGYTDNYDECFTLTCHRKSD